MKKGILIGIVCILSILLTGCSKDKIDSNTFKSILTESGFNVTQETNNISIDIKELYVGTKEDGYLIEYYQYENEDFAKKAYESKKETYKNNNIKKTQIESEAGNYSRYALTSDGRYYFIGRVDNTIVLVLSSEKDKKDAEGVIKKLGY